MIRLENLTLAYSERTLIDCANIHFTAGTVTALVGRNGAGKSTLLRALAAIESPKSGNIYIGDSNIHTLSAEQRAKMIAFVSTHRVRVANLRCIDVVATGRAPYTNWIGTEQKEDKEIVNSALQAVGMSSFANRTIDSLSDGECQRIMIARALAQQTPVIMLDEPTAFLDIPTRFEICRLLANLAHNQGKTILFSTHDIDAALPSCDTVAVINNNTIDLLPAATANEVLSSLFSL